MTQLPSATESNNFDPDSWEDNEVVFDDPGNDDIVNKNIEKSTAKISCDDDHQQLMKGGMTAIATDSNEMAKRMREESKKLENMLEETVQQIKMEELGQNEGSQHQGADDDCGGEKEQMGGEDEAAMGKVARQSAGEMTFLKHMRIVEEEAAANLDVTPRAMLVSCYQEHCPRKLEQVDRVLLKYKGTEQKLFLGLSKKYGVHPSTFGNLIDVQEQGYDDIPVTPKPKFDAKKPVIKKGEQVYAEWSKGKSGENWYQGKVSEVHIINEGFGYGPVKKYVSHILNFSAL